VARLFGEHGARMLLMDRDAAGCRAVAESLPGAASLAGDVRNAGDFERVVTATLDRYDRIDILINNAGIYPRQAFLEMTEAQWDEMQDVNLKSMFHSMKAVLPQMVARQSGKIVNISSVTFHLGMAALSHYVASKGGVIGLTRSLAREMGPHNIHINCITPGAIKTVAEAKVVTEEQVRQFMASQSLQRRIMPLDVARVCLFLSSELSDGMTGQVLNVDGGWVMH
jgi:3-oxoacyl-[acyl-carrier protein] reductase